MSYVEVDTKLFITCRLCLEESGTYQIIPAIQTQISYCFGINVEPFDGLPQLICKKCQTTLSYISETKETFVQRQDELKKKVRENTTPQANENVPKQTTEELTAKQLNKDNNKLWQTKYHKRYICRLCNSKWSTWRSVMSHATRHENIKKKNLDIFNRYCTVALPKIDAKKNLTGSSNKVVFNKGNIIAQGNADYYISFEYITNDKCENEDSELSTGLNNDADSSDEILPRRKLKRKIISSESSTDTVVLENKSNNSENDCISIGDTDSDDETKKPLKKAVTKNNESKVNELQRLIASTANKYAKKQTDGTKLSHAFDQQLKRKVLSIGRKIVNKQGFNCSGVIKFLENLNLDIIWLPRSPINITSASNYLKIIARMKKPDEKKLDFDGFEVKYVRRKEAPRTFIEVHSAAKGENCADKNEGISGTVIHDHHYTNGINTPTDNFETKPDPINGVSVSTELDAAILYTISAADPQKLLNSNPVANPKQLPRKYTTTEIKSKYPKNMNKNTEVEVNMEEVNDGDDMMIEMQMPIITSTTSLAVPRKTDTTNNVSSDCHSNNNANASRYNENKPEVPRIKVKSAAELMSKETLSRMFEPAANSHDQHSVSSPQNQTVSASTRSQSTDFVFLDSVELPNTKVSSPFTYFKSLLAIHNIVLLDTETNLSRDFNNLVRFKVLYNQEYKERVVISLSLHCLNNVFCLKIQDRNNENINMTKVSAVWQWEILKIFKGEVVNKILDSAQKIGKEVYDYTNRLLCLLKSINYLPT